MSNKVSSEAEKKITPMENFYGFVSDFVLYFAIIILIMSFFFRISQVFGISMENTLHEGDRLLLLSTLYTPERGDIVVISQPNALTGEYEKNLVKRVIGIPGDVIDIDYAEGRVYRNGAPLYEPYIMELINRQDEGSPTSFPITVSEGHVFVMGDNRNHSLDSRDQSVGLVDTRYIIGKALFRFWPPSRFKIFENPEPVEKQEAIA